MRSRAALLLLCLFLGASQTIVAVADEVSPAFTSDIAFYQTEQNTEKLIEQRSSDLAPAEGQLSLQAADKINAELLPLQLEFLNNQPNDLWERIRSGFALAELDSPLVQEHEAWYANRPDYVRRTVERSQRYLFHIVEEIEKRGMPTEIALLPIIESAFNPKAYSVSNASGIWQFIPSTGKNFGLNQNSLYDGRRDILAATDAALDYLQKLYNMFGSWELALASYNWGEGSVSRAIARNQAKGESTDYLSLRMPPETRNYVPKLLAVKKIIMNPAAYGIALGSVPNRPYFGKVKVSQQIDVSVAARLAEVPLDEFVALNPAYNKPLVAGVGRPTLLLPVNKVNSFNLNLENYEHPLSSWQTYTAQRGEKLDTIARRFGMSVARLKEINGINGQKKLAASQTLMIPLAKPGSTATLLAHIPDQEAREKPTSTTKSTHTVGKGETLHSIARRYDITVAQLKSQNNLKSSRLSNGQKLTVLASSSKRAEKATLAKNKTESARTLRMAKNASKQAKNSRYIVKRGDTVFSIARRFDVAVNDLQRWNKIPSSNNLQPGNSLVVNN